MIRPIALFVAVLGLSFGTSIHARTAIGSLGTLGRDGAGADASTDGHVLAATDAASPRRPAVPLLPAGRGEMSSLPVRTID